jgi:DNA-binding CsgD family transcriptional regulator
VVSATAYATSRERIVRICAAESNDRTLRLALLEEIRSVVDFDAYAWLLTDPETSVGCAPLADVPSLAELPRLIRLKYLSTVNRWTVLDDPPVSTLHARTGGDLTKSTLWRELLSNYDVGDVASAVFRDQFGCWGFLDLWRTGPTGRFYEAETAFLAGIAAPVTTALRRAQAGTFLAPTVNDDPRPLGPVVLLLSSVLEILRETPASDQYLRLLVPPEHDRPPIPSTAYNAGAQLLAVEAGIDANDPSARMHLTRGLWVTVRAARIGTSGAPGGQDIAVTIETTSPTERLAVFARAFGLTRRETDLLEHLATGIDTRDLARRTFLSEYTVQDHLKAIFAKTSTRNRRSLLSRALGT